LLKQKAPSGSRRRGPLLGMTRSPP